MTDTTHSAKAREIAESLKRTCHFNDDGDSRSASEARVWVEAIDALMQNFEHHKIFLTAFTEGRESAAKVADEERETCEKSDAEYLIKVGQVGAASRIAAAIRRSPTT